MSTSGPAGAAAAAASPSSPSVATVPSLPLAPSPCRRRAAEASAFWMSSSATLPATVTDAVAPSSLWEMRMLGASAGIAEATYKVTRGLKDRGSVMSGLEVRTSRCFKYSACTALSAIARTVISWSRNDPHAASSAKMEGPLLR